MERALIQDLADLLYEKSRLTKDSGVSGAIK